MKRKYFLLLIPVSILCILLAKMFPAVAEYIFARGLFKIISVPLGFITGLFPFSIAVFNLYSPKKCSESYLEVLPVSV